MKSGAVPLARWEGEGGSLADEHPSPSPKGRLRLHAASSTENEHMKIQIRGRGVEVAETLRTHVKHRLGLALARFGDEIDRVIVRLSASKSQRFGDKRCELEVRLRPQSLTAEDSANDLLGAVDHAIDRVVRRVARTLEHEHESSAAGRPPPRVRRASKP